MDPFAVLRIRNFVSFTFARFFLTLANQMQSVIVGWQVYENTKDPLSLGLIGLAEIIPFLLVVLFAGHLADIVERKRIIAGAVVVSIFCSCLLFYFTLNDSSIIQQYGITPIYSVIFITGIVRAFNGPSFFALLAQLVPKELYANAATWNSSTWQIGAVAGPAIGGLIYGFYGVTVSYGVITILMFLCLIAVLLIPTQPKPGKSVKESLLSSIAAGVKFVFKNQVMLAALSLDLFAVLFGGAVALIPVFTDKILHEGPEVLGILRAAPAMGAVIMAVAMAYKPPFKHAGRNLLLSVAGFGMSIIIFALSTNLYLSLIALMMSGALDNVSVVIRHTILQTMTPDEMRGRVSSVNSIFIGSSNEIGQFESGITAKIMGLVPAVIFGGSMTLAIVIATWKKAPLLIKLKLSR